MALETTGYMSLIKHEQDGVCKDDGTYFTLPKVNGISNIELSIHRVLPNVSPNLTI